MGFIRAIIKLPLLFWIAVIGGYLYYTHMLWEENTYTPLVNEVSTAKEEFKTLEIQNREAVAFEKERDSRFQKLQSLAEEFNQALDKLPRSSDTPGLLSNLAEISDRVGVEFARFEPGKPALNGFLMETPFKVELRGSFVQIMSFLDEVAHLKRIVTGKSLTLREPLLRGQTAMLRAEAVLVTYYFDESAKPSANNLAPAPSPGPSTPPASSSATSEDEEIGRSKGP